MIELIIVIILLGIVAAVVAPKINTDATQVPPAADIVASDITSTQLKAMAQNTSMCITLASNSQTYNYDGTCSGASCATCSGGISRDLSNIGSGGVKVQTGQTLKFNALGEPYGLAAAVTITVGNSADTKDVVVEPYTGKVTVQ